MTGGVSKRQLVVYAFPISHRFRAPFHELLKTKLNDLGVDYLYVYARFDNAGKRDTIDLEWAAPAPLWTFTFWRTRLFVHFFYKYAGKADLIILQQQNNLLMNYLYQLGANRIVGKVGFFGHGRNFQSKNSRGLSESWKRLWMKNVDWWFTYTSGCARSIEDSGYPSDRITVFNNSIDLTAIASERTKLNSQRQAALRAELVAGSENVAVYVGGLYKEKRLEFLIEAADSIRERIHDFHLIVIGGGPEVDRILRAAGDRPWLIYAGPKFGFEKTELVSLAKLWLMPGLVGLGILDSFAYEIPMVTTRLQYHSPEIEYLISGFNGLMIDEADDPSAYAGAVSELLSHHEAREVLVTGARASLENYSLEAMADRFVSGVMEALRRPPRRKG